MHYYSTRDVTKEGQPFSFEKVLFSAYTSDGGLYVPRELPDLDWRKWETLTYPGIVAEILKAFVDDERVNIEEIIKTVYPGHFDNPDIIPVVKPGNDQMYVMELFHGPTWSFKDYALQIIGQLLSRYLEGSGDHVTLLIVTSGDTGSAAIEAVKNCPNIDIIVLLPDGLISPTQERQMTTVISDNVHVIPGEGDSGPLDTAARLLFEDVDFVRRYNVASINSINWARIMVQMAHWFYGYFRVMEPLKRLGDRLTVAIPTGAAGNLSAALYAQKLGLPIDIVACNNENNTIHQWIKTGLLERVSFRATLASAMDIDLPYNIERIMHVLAYSDSGSAEKSGKTSGEMMQKFYAGGKAETEPELLQKMRRTMTSCAVSNADIESTIKRLQLETGYVCCPHTATSIWYAYENMGNRPILCAATASPSKFVETFSRLGIELAPDSRLENLQKAPTRTAGMLRKGEDWVEVIKKKVIEISLKYKK